HILPPFPTRRSSDLMYQGLTIAFDFAIEEIWVPLAVGATLVPGPTGARLLGKDLGDFLAEKNITALCCVPTLLATLEAELPQLQIGRAHSELQSREN